MLKIYTLYKHPSDYPGEYVVRRTVINYLGGIVPDKDIYCKSKFLENVQAIMEELGLVFLNRRDDDDEVIMGVYL